MTTEPKLTKPDLEHICDLTVELGPIHEMGKGRAGNRRIIPIIGGVVAGPKLQGKILNIGADWQTIFDNGPSKGLAELDTRYAMETHDGAIIEIINFGYRFGPADVLAAVARGEDVSPDAYSMRTMAKLETGDERYEWVNKTLFVGTGARQKSAVIVSLFAVQ